MTNRISSELLGFDKSIAIKLKKKIEAFGLTSDLCLAAMRFGKNLILFLNFCREISCITRTGFRTRSV